MKVAVKGLPGRGEQQRIVSKSKSSAKGCALCACTMHSTNEIFGSPFFATHTNHHSLSYLGQKPEEGI